MIIFYEGCVINKSYNWFQKIFFRYRELKIELKDLIQNFQIW